MSLFYPPTPNIESDLINVTKFVKGFRFKINPISNTGDVKSYNFYAREYSISTNPNSNENNYLINNITYSKEEQYYYFVPKREGFYEIAVFTESPLGYESTGVLITGRIEKQEFIKEINIKNINYYDGISGSMIYATGNEISLTTDKAIFGWEYDFIAQSSEEVKKYSPEIETFDFQSYLGDTTINFVDRFIYNDSDNLFLDSTSLKNIS